MTFTPEQKAALAERRRLQHLVISAYHVIGDRALAYLLNVTPKKAGEYLLGNLPKVEPELLELIDGLLKPAESGEEPLSVRLHTIARSFVGYMSEYDTSICNTIRLASGGKLSDTDHKDPVAGPLRRLARDVGPLFLLFEATDGGVAEEGIEPVYGRRDSLVAAPIADYPVHDQLIAALEADPELKELLGPKVDLSTFLGSKKPIKDFPMSWLSTSAHVPTPLERGDGMVRMLLDGAYDRVRLRGKNGPEKLIEEIPPYLDDVRALASGKKRKVVALTGLAGVELPEGAKQATTPWGVLRGWRESDRDFIDWTPAPTLVLQREIEIRAFVREEAEDKREGALLSTASNQAVMAALTVMLVSSPSVAPKIVWQTVQHPLGADQFVPIGSFRGPGATLDKVDLPELRRVSKLVATRHRQTIDIAVRRTLRAAAEREDETDQFIDAVIAWENLFGSGSEIGFRISVGMSMLLGTDDAERKSLQGEINKLYNLRSKYVHGAVVKPKDQVANAGPRATELAVAALKALYLEHHKILGVDAAQRVQALLYRP
jgi:hypothetical protein